MHPDGRYLLVTNRFSNFACVIDTHTDAVVAEIPLDFYCQGIMFDQEGRTAYIANRYLDQVFVVDVERGGRLVRRRLCACSAVSTTRSSSERCIPALVPQLRRSERLPRRDPRRIRGRPRRQGELRSRRSRTCARGMPQAAGCCAATVRTRSVATPTASRCT